MNFCKCCYSSEVIEKMTEEQIDAYRDRFLGMIKPSDENLMVSEDAVVEAFEELIEEIRKADNSCLHGVSDSHFTKFCCYLTGHDEEIISQMYQDWKGYR